MSAEPPVDRRRTWPMGVLPVVLLGALLALVASSRPAELILGDASPPPVEVLQFLRVTLEPGGIVAAVLNDGPDPVRVAQVQVDDAYWAFSADPGPELAHLERATLSIPYPWVEGETHVVRLVTSTGLTFDHEIAVAVQTPRASARSFLAFTLIGVYVGVLPVAVGLLWLPWVARLGATGLAYVLALTVGLLIFLMVDASREGLEVAATLPASYQGIALLVFSAALAYLALEKLGAWLRSTRSAAGPPASQGRILALLIAVGIGLHNFAEGLAIGAAFALGEAGLGTLLIVGFMLHNTTEGLAIVAPLAREPIRIGLLVRLGLIGGFPTILGAWLGGLVYSPFWAVVCLGIGTGAILQVVWQIVRQMVGEQPMTHALAAGPVLGGLCTGFGLMYVTGMLVT